MWPWTCPQPETWPPSSGNSRPKSISSRSVWSFSPRTATRPWPCWAARTCASSSVCRARYSPYGGQCRHSCRPVRSQPAHGARQRRPAGRGDTAAAGGANAPRLVAVTTLTSLIESDLTDLGIQRSLADQAQRLGEMAVASGVNGSVTSVHEVRVLREKFGPGMILVTPGIRPVGADAGDQKRVATPARWPCARAPAIWWWVVRSWKRGSGASRAGDPGRDARGHDLRKTLPDAGAVRRAEPPSVTTNPCVSERDTG